MWATFKSLPALHVLLVPMAKTSHTTNPRVRAEGDYTRARNRNIWKNWDLYYTTMSNSKLEKWKRMAVMNASTAGKSSWVPILYSPVSVPSRFPWFLCPPSSSTCSKKSLSYFRWPLTGVIWHPICIGLSQAQEWFFYKTCIKQATAPAVLVCKWALRLLRVPWTPWRSNQSILKGNQSQIFIERTGAEAEAPILWTLDAKNWLIGIDSDAG